MKQETLGKAAEKYAKKTYRMFNETELEYPIEDFVSGAKWQQEQDKQEIQDLKNRLDIVRESSNKAIKMIEDLEVSQRYNQEEVEIIIQKLMNDVHCGDLCYGDNVIDFKLSPRQWFEQFKKK